MLEEEVPLVYVPLILADAAVAAAVIADVIDVGITDSNILLLESSPAIPFSEFRSESST
jgi:hypothetical protein